MTTPGLNQNTRQPRHQLSTSLARTGAEFEEAQRLRYKVFIEEMGAAWHCAREKIDHDNFDFYCEHLLVRDNSNNKVISTCRILPPEQAQARSSYFTETEFDLSRLFQIRARIAEVSHLCCHRDYRDRATIAQLWNGLNNYMSNRNHNYLIGCINLSMGDGGHYVASVYHKIHQRYTAPAEYRVFPRCALPLRTLNNSLDVSIPPLLQNFLRQGAYICGAPAWNVHFNTADLFIILPLSRPTSR